MAGDWIKMECSTPDKPEVLAITGRMGWDDPDLTVGKLFRVWRWFDQHTAEGNADSVTLALVDRISGVTGFAQAMQSVGWLEADEHGVRLPNFGRHCGKTAKTRAQTARRVSSHKENAKGNGGGNGGGNAASVTKSVPPALPREEKRRYKECPPQEAASADGVDPVKQLFDFGVRILTCGGKSESAARSFIGSLRQRVGEEEAWRLLLASRSTTDPAAYITKASQPKLRKVALC